MAVTVRGPRPGSRRRLTRVRLRVGESVLRSDSDSRPTWPGRPGVRQRPALKLKLAHLATVNGSP
jgi:hypothetical protein